MRRRENSAYRFNPAALYMRVPVRQILKQIWEYPLTVVEAPLGYGKTTAVREYLTECQANLLWHTVASDSAIEFWRNFSQLFKHIAPRCAEGLSELESLCDSQLMASAVELVKNVVWPEKSVLVLDDYHLLSSDTIEQFIELVVKNASPGFHIVIISRARFGENTTELALKGYCNVIGKKQFEFTQTEIMEYYKLCGLRITTYEAAQLHAYTEGWISALYLSMLSFAREGRVDRQASLHELIEKVVYRQCTAVMKDFLLSVSVFDRFTLSQAQAMWQGEDAAAILDELVANNALIQYDGSKKTYQMHNIFTTYLRELLGLQDRKRQQAVWRLAGDWYARSRDYIHAIDCFFQAADYDRLLMIMEEDKGHSIKNEHKDRMIRYFHYCPSRIRRTHPWACLVYAMYLFVFNEMELFSIQCAEIGGYIALMEEDKQRTKQQLAGELEILRSFTQFNCIAGMTRHHQQAARLLQGPSKFISNRAPWTFGAPSVLYMYHRESGQLEKEVVEMAQAMPHYYRLTGDHGFGAELVMEAERYHVIGDFEKAEITAYEALHAAQSREQTAIVLCVVFLQMRLALVRGDLAVMQSTLAQTREELKRQKLYSYNYTVDLCEGFIYACLNQAGKIPAWIAQGEAKSSVLYATTYTFFNIVQGKALLLGGHYRKLLERIGPFTAIATGAHNLQGQVYINIYAAAAQYQLEQFTEAHTSMKQALDIAAPDQLIMPFVENGEYIFPILQTLGQRGQHASFINRIATFYATYVGKIAAMQGETRNFSKLASLSAREMEVSSLVAAGLPNQTIAARLLVEEATVKKTLQNIFAKLGINRRSVLARLIIEQKMPNNTRKNY